MARETFSTTQWLPFPVDQVFSFFANPHNLPPLMPAWQKARIEQASFAAPPPNPARLPGLVAGSGSRLTISARVLPLCPVRLPWEALIEDFRWNEGFCDVQVRGPFRYWRHCHTVQPETRDGVEGALLRDEVVYELPLWSGLARPGLAYVFRHRQKRAEELLGR